LLFSYTERLHGSCGQLIFLALQIIPILSPYSASCFIATFEVQDLPHKGAICWGGYPLGFGFGVGEGHSSAKMQNGKQAVRNQLSASGSFLKELFDPVEISRQE